MVSAKAQWFHSRLEIVIPLRFGSESNELFYEFATPQEDIANVRSLAQIIRNNLRVDATLWGNNSVWSANVAHGLINWIKKSILLFTVATKLHSYTSLYK